MRPPLRFKPVRPDVTAHAVEQRGFLPVPLDWAAPEGPRIDLFYRLIPAHGGRAADVDKPIVVVINGGPGIPASFYRPLDFDYQTNAMPPGELDRFKYLLATHRVLLVDQRGTDGQSAPLDMDDPGLDAALVGRLFSSDSHARDYLAVIDALIPEDAPFYVIAQSYGGLPGMQLLGLIANEAARRRRPRGIVFSSAALPFTDPFAAMARRREEQRRLNLHLRSMVPDIEARLARARAHCAEVGLDPVLVHGLYVVLGKGVAGVWEPAIARRLETMAQQTRAQILADVQAGLEGPSLLNYILSSVNFSPGHTDRTLAAAGSRALPFEPWMIDEHEVLLRTGQDGSWREALTEAFDRAPPPGTPFPSLEVLRAGIATTQVLFTAAENDAFVPCESYVASAARFAVPGHTAVRTLPGGHHAIFLAKGYEAFLAWSRAI